MIKSLGLAEMKQDVDLLSAFLILEGTFSTFELLFWPRDTNKCNNAGTACKNYKDLHKHIINCAWDQES